MKGQATQWSKENGQGQATMVRRTSNTMTKRK